MMAESYNRRLILLLNFEIVDQKKLIWISGSVTFLFLTLELKLFFFALFFVLTALLIYLFAYISSYGSGLGFSLLRTKLYDNALPKMSWLAISKYLTRVSTVTGMAVAPIIWFVFFVFVLFSFFPKKYDIKHQEDDTHVNAVFDSNGNPLFIEHTNGNGSIPLEYEEMPEFLLKMLYLQEDRFFLKQNRWFINRSNWHGFSLATFYRYFSSGGGGSNLNMQLIKNEAFPTASFPQDIQRKFAETVTSYHLSLQMRPEEIVTQYLNKISMNGGIGHSGLMAASLYTFNLPVWDLNPLEMLYMVNTLKSGSSFRTINGIYIPYRSTESHQEEIKNTLIEKAEVWLNNGHITKPEYNMLRNSDLRFKNHSPKIETNSSTRDFLIKEIKRINSSAFKYRSSLSLENQKKVAVAVQTFESKFSHDLRNGDYQLYSATLVVNIETGEVIGHYGGHGTSDLTRFSAGFPMSSLIKPFVLLELLEQGFPSNLQLYDGPIDGKFTPQNHNHQYLYRHVGIREILTDSKNAPMVNIREITNPLPLYRNVENRFNNMGISEDPFLNFNNTLMQQELILNYPLGSRNMTLYDIAQAYQVLLNNGEYIKLSVLRKNTQKQSRVINKKRIYTRNALYIKSALQGPFMLGGTAHHLINQLPDGRVYYAKTGTSDGAKHGYTVLSDGNLMVVSYVTYGKNEDGHLELNDTPPIPHQSGGVVRENLLL